MRRRIVSAALAGMLACTTLVVPANAATTGTKPAVTAKATTSNVVTTKKTMYTGTAYSTTVKGATKKNTEVAVSKKGIVKVTCTADGKYKISGKKAGTVTISFKDKKTGKVLKKTKVTVKSTEDNYVACLDKIMNGYEEFSFTGNFDMNVEAPIDPELGKKPVEVESCSVMVSGDILKDAVQMKISFDVMMTAAPEIVTEDEDAWIKVQGDATEIRIVDDGLYVNYGMLMDFLTKLKKDNPKTLADMTFENGFNAKTDWVKLMDAETFNELLGIMTATPPALPEGGSIGGADMLVAAPTPMPTTAPIDFSVYEDYFNAIEGNVRSFVTDARKSMFKRIDAKSSKVFTKKNGFYEFTVNKNTLGAIIGGTGTFIEKDAVNLLNKQVKALKKGDEMQKSIADALSELVAMLKESKGEAKTAFAEIDAQLPALLAQIPDFELKLRAKESKGTANLGCTVAVPEIDGGSIAVNASAELKKYSGDTSDIIVAPTDVTDVTDTMAADILAMYGYTPTGANTSAADGNLTVNA